MHYRLLVSIEVIEFIERLPEKTREALRRAIRFRMRQADQTLGSLPAPVSGGGR